MTKIRELYQKAKAAKVGEVCICPSCNAKFTKTNYQQAFCRTRGKSICKDKYWNTVSPQKRCNTTRISPASKKFMEIHGNQKRFGVDAPNVHGSGIVTGITSEGYRIMDGIAYDEWDDAVYSVDPSDDNHPFDMDA